MSLFELFLIAVGLSMDTFAVAVCVGLSLNRVDMKSALTIGVYFGGFQAAMPLAGYLLGTQFAGLIAAYGDYIAFALLSVIGGRMVHGSFDSACPSIGQDALRPAKMLPLSVATSIDAFAIGVSFALLDVRILPAVSLIGVTTLLLSMAGARLGRMLGGKFKSRAEFAGGAMLILIGVKILLERFGVL